MFLELKKNRKAQTELVAYMLVAAIIIFSTGVAYMWGVPVIEKSSSNSKIKAAQSQLTNINEEISNVLLNGGQTNVILNIDGELKIDEKTNSFYYSFKSPVTHITSEEWIPVSGSNMWGVNGTPEETGAGRMGIDDPGVLLARAHPTGDEYFITFRLAYRELDDLTTTGGKKVKLVIKGNGAASGKSTLLIRSDEAYVDGDAVYGGDLVIIPIELALK